MQSRLAALIIAFWLAGTAFAQSLEELVWMSEQYPPYNYQDEHRQPRGIVLEVISAMLDDLGHPWDQEMIAFLPWARSYARLQREPGTALFSMVVTPPRQKLFRFVGPVISTHIVLLAQKNRGLKVASPKDLDRLRIGVVREDIGEQLLEELGVVSKAVFPGSRVEHLIRQMQRGRLDAIAYGEQVARWQIKQLGLNPQDYEAVYQLQEGALGIAFHPDVAPATLMQLQEALERLKAAGQVELIARRYLE